MTSPAPTDDLLLRRQRQVIYWRLLGGAFGMEKSLPNFEAMTTEVVTNLGLPPLITESNLAVDTLVQRYPELKDDFEQLREVCNPGADEEETDAEEAEEGAAEAKNETAAPEPVAIDKPLAPTDIRRGLAYSKLLLNVFGPNTQGTNVTAAQYSQWIKDVARFEECFGYAPGTLRGQRGGGSGASQHGTGMGPLISEEELRAGLKAMEGDLIKRMALREVLKDDQMAAQLSPSMDLVEQLLRDKSNLSGNALKNAKSLILQYVAQLAEVLRLQVQRAVKGKLDRSVPPKRVFRNLDLKRTLWKNLINYNPKDGRLYVDRLFYKQSAKKTTPTRMIVVVDQSGSMVDAMVQCTILASIFAGLPRVDMHLLAFDTQVIDLTPWVHDPFEVLMRTNLGGGTYIRKALLVAAEKIEEPRNTAMVLISDFFEGGSDQELLDTIKAIKDSGVHFIPVGAVTSSGYFSVCQFFRDRLKELGMPILSGNIKKLINELKNVL